MCVKTDLFARGQQFKNGNVRDLWTYDAEWNTRSGVQGEDGTEEAKAPRNFRKITNTCLKSVVFIANIIMAKLYANNVF